MGISRRTFLFLTGGAGAGLAAEPGRQMVNKLIPWVVPPENVRPGEWTSFATTCRECPAGCGMVLMHREGRVTKAEAHPEHPVSRGGLCPRGQSSVQGLYDPDRVTKVRFRRRGEALRDSSWGEALQALAGKLRSGVGRVAVLSDLQTGSLAEVMDSFVRAFDSDRLLFHEAFNYEPLRAAHRSVFGVGEIPEYRLEECDFALSFSADFLETWVSPVALSRQFSAMRTLREGKLGRFAYVGPLQSMTAANADDFLQVSPGRERWVALAIVQEMEDRGFIRENGSRVKELLSRLGGRKAGKRSGIPGEKIRELARRFAQGRSVALAAPTGASGGAARDTAVAAALLNLAAGSLGKSVSFERVHALGKTATEEELVRFARSLAPEDILFIVHANPFFTRPHLAPQLRRAGTIVHLTTLPDETAEEADWVLPVDSPLEAWGDYEPYSGIHSLLQPTMARLYDSRMAGDVFIALADAAGKPLERQGDLPETPNDFPSWVQGRWGELYRREGGGGAFEDFWLESLRRGGHWGEARKSAGSAAGGEIRFAPFKEENRAPEEAALWLWPSIYLFDGRLANRGWMQEHPHPVSTVAWGSWIDLHPQKAKSLGVQEGDVVEIATAEGKIEAPARITLEVAPEAAAIPIGQGHSAPGFSVARGIGANPFQLLGGAPEGVFPRAVLRRTGRKEKLVCVSADRGQHHREIVQTVPLKGVEGIRPGEITFPTPAGYHPDRDIYAPHDHKKHRWAMAIDLQKCIGCHACSVACYAENNIPVMGRKLVAQGREMAWLRVPPYRHPEDPSKISWLPLPCQHCDAAPCEPVCPVYAAVHNEEGLNAQIYNRCIGTRYCSNNCPYKVRRFNWFDVRWKPPLELQLNPEVTVRCRGVMEKCTFCVQRIRYAEQKARVEGRSVRDGEVVPACVQTCPARVFVFGDLMDPRSEVSKLFREDPRRYQVLKELNTKPAVVYLKKIRIEEG